MRSSLFLATVFVFVTSPLIGLLNKCALIGKKQADGAWRAAVDIDHTD
jgi:hypothetical protein